jgi:class 3 adenylate cyclase
VNLASRLEAHGEPGRVLVSESTAVRLADRYDFAPTQILDVEGKGATPVRVLLGRRADAPITVPSSAHSD